MSAKVSDLELQYLIAGVETGLDVNKALVVSALRELEERRRVDRDLVNARPRNVRYAGSGARRRK